MQGVSTYFGPNYCIQVNTNGVISFLREVKEFTPAAFPLSGNRRLVAPFWADVDIRKNGQVFYRQTASDTKLLQQTTLDVTNTFVDHRKFKATWVFVVTWHEVPFFGARGNSMNKVREQIKQLLDYILELLSYTQLSHDFLILSH